MKFRYGDLVQIVAIGADKTDFYEGIQGEVKGFSKSLLEYETISPYIYSVYIDTYEGVITVPQEALYLVKGRST